MAGSGEGESQWEREQRQREEREARQQARAERQLPPLYPEQPSASSSAGEVAVETGEEEETLTPVRPSATPFFTENPLFGSQTPTTPLSISYQPVFTPQELATPPGLAALISPAVAAGHHLAAAAPFIPQVLPFEWEAMPTTSGRSDDEERTKGSWYPTLYKADGGLEWIRFKQSAPGLYRAAVSKLGTQPRMADELQLLSAGISPGSHAAVHLRQASNLLMWVHQWQYILKGAQPLPPAPAAAPWPVTKESPRAPTLRNYVTRLRDHQDLLGDDILRSVLAPYCRLAHSFF